MPLRFNRRFGVLPGVRINLSKSGPSVSVGAKGAWFTVGPRGTRASLGVPGTGLGWYQQTPWANKAQQATTSGPRSGWRVLIWLVALAVLAFLAAMSGHSAAHAQPITERICHLVTISEAPEFPPRIVELCTIHDHEERAILERTRSLGEGEPN